MGEAGGGLPGNRHGRTCMEVPVELSRPPSLPLICKVFPDHSSFSVLGETPMIFSSHHFKKLKRYQKRRICRPRRSHDSNHAGYFYP
jgi:hypothetical protein